MARLDQIAEQVFGRDRSHVRYQRSLTKLGHHPEHRQKLTHLTRSTALLVGGAAGELKGNRHIEVEKETPLANLMVSLANVFDCESDKFGISTGRVTL